MAARRANWRFGMRVVELGFVGNLKEWLADRYWGKGARL
jgi:hypothetical protein